MISEIERITHARDKGIISEREADYLIDDLIVESRRRKPYFKDASRPLKPDPDK